ncbi:MAG: hypothetical protein HFG29_02845 [Eubacterium sp.]|nr:hypothetical protein [Eubacterium sp.]
MKNKISIILVFIITLLVLVGGLFIMQQRLDTQSVRLLNEKLNSKETIFRSNSEKKELNKKFLTKNELVEVVHSMENKKNMRPHEPVKGQLSMNQAITKGKEWVQKLFSTKIQTYKKVSANLCTNDSAGINKIPGILYGFWEVKFEKKNLMVKMSIHSVTGQLLGIEVYSYNKQLKSSYKNPEKILAGYVRSLNMKSNTCIYTEGGLYEKIADGDLYAVLEIGSVQISTKSRKYDFDGVMALHLVPEI